jgi:hypothetical protein
VGADRFIASLANAQLGGLDSEPGAGDYTAIFRAHESELLG